MLVAILHNHTFNFRQQHFSRLQFYHPWDKQCYPLFLLAGWNTSHRILHVSSAFITNTTPVVTLLMVLIGLLKRLWGLDEHRAQDSSLLMLNKRCDAVTPHLGEMKGILCWCKQQTLQVFHLWQAVCHICSESFLCQRVFLWQHYWMMGLQMSNKHFICCFMLCVRANVSPIKTNWRDSEVQPLWGAETSVRSIITPAYKCLFSHSDEESTKGRCCS